MDPIGLAIIGSTGAIGKTHIDAINKLSSCRLVGVTARNQGPLGKQARELGVKAFASLEATLRDPEVNAIVIATPHPSHRNIALQAMEEGKHVLVEKPLSVTPSEADQMITLSRRLGVTLGVLFNNRFRTEAINMKNLIEDGVLGPIYRTHMISAMFRPQGYYDQLDWRGTWENEGGGVLLNQGIHAIDMLIWLTGMPTSVSAQIRTIKHSIEVEDYATAILEYESGALGTLHCNTVQVPSKQRIEIYGENGALIMDDWKITLHRFRTPIRELIENDSSVLGSQWWIDSSAYDSENLDTLDSIETHAPAIDDFARAIIYNRDPAVTGEEGRKAQEVVAAITMSGCLGTKISLPVDRSEYDVLLENLIENRRLPDS